MTRATRVQSARGSALAIRIGIGIALSILGGLMILLSFPPYGIWPLIWVAFVPYLFAQHRLMPPRLSSLAPALAIGVWLGPYLGRIFGSETGFFFQFLGVWIALITLLTQTERRFHELTHYRWFVLQGVVSWVGFEMIRTFIPLLATNAFVGYTLASQAWLIQPVSIFSVYGMNLLIMLVNFALAQGLLAWFDRRWPLPDAVPVEGSNTKQWLVITGLSFTIWTGISLLILISAPAETATVRVAALQPNFPEPAHQDPATPPETRMAMLTLQVRDAALQGAQVIFTPEMGLGFDPQVKHTEMLRALATETQTYIFLTYVVSDEAFRNEAVLLNPSGEFLEVYGKNHVFGEPRTPSAGVYPVYETELGRLATLICHDANYTDVARRLTRNGAQLIAMPVREFGGVGEQLWTNVVFRAVENRVAAVLTGVAYSSAIVDPYGRLIALEVNPDGERLTLIRDVPLGSGNAPLVYVGDWLGWLCLGGYLFFMVFMAMVERDARKAK